jgi:uncharacterized protein (TIGR03437 family)
VRYSTSFVLFVSSSLLSGALLAQAPAVTAIQNPASNIPAALPNGGIAQGSVFVIYGTNLAPPSLIFATLPLPTTAGVGGTTVTITVKGVTVTAPMVYTLDTQIVGLLPSTTPTGQGVVNVSSNGKAAPAFPINVVASAFGISTLDQTGGNGAVVTFPDATVVFPTKSAKPGDTLVLWGTGLGAIAGDDTVVPTANIDPGLSIQVWVGGISAAVAYRGRSGAPGLDQINFVVPPGLSGCNVSLAVQTGAATLSNYTTIPIAADGGTCSDVNNLNSSAVFSSILAKSTSNVFAFRLKQVNNTSGDGSAAVNVQSVFAHFGPGEVAALSKDLFRTPSPGSCVVVINGAGKDSSFAGLDAGASVTVTPPSGAPRSIASVAKGVYQASPAALLPDGAYKETITGGADVAAMNLTFTIPPFVTWTNRSAFGGSGNGIDRSKGLTVTWTGGGTDSANYVLIHGDTGFGGPGATNAGIEFGCAVSAAAGQFTVPPAVLLAFPPEPGGSLQVGTESAQLIAVPGLDGGLVQASSASKTDVSWK